MSYDDLDTYELYDRFEEHYEEYKNGNITDFKNWLGSMKGHHIFMFIKWLQESEVKL
jgi:hypothetical protein